MLAHVRGIAVEGPLGPDAIARLFERIIDEARRLERRVVHDEGDGRPRTSMISGWVAEAKEAMVVVMEERATEAQIEQVVARLVEMGLDVHRSTGVTRTVLGAVGQSRPDPRLIEMLDGVHEVLRISEPYKLASRTFKPENTVVTVGDVRIGGDEVIVMAGPCSAETEQQVRDDGGGRPARRREDPARRRVQAAQLAVQLPGARRGRAAAAARRGRTRRT